MVNRHFFKPLLPGFHSQLTIPVAFFLKNLQGRNEQKTAELRSDASKITWKVNLDGQRFTDGWKEFALAHDLRIGDILVFRHEGDMSFHVTMLGPSCCEIQYGSCLDDKNNLEKIETGKKVKKDPKTEAESSSLDSSYLVANVRSSNLHYDLLNLPRGFVTANGIVTGSGKIVLMNEKGKSWTLKLRQKPSCGTIYIRGGWRSFCGDNGFRAGDILTFKLTQREGTFVLRLSSKESEEEANEVSLSTEPESHEERIIGKIQRNKKMKKKPRRKTKSSSLDPSCFETNIAPSTLRYDTLYLPMRFVRANGLLSTRCKKMILMNEKGRSWTLDLKRRKTDGITFIKRGWTSFCTANGLRAGSIITFKLIKKGESLVLRLKPNESEEEEDECSEENEVESHSTDQESDEESSQEEKISQKFSRRKEKKRRLRWKTSSSPSQNRFVTLTLKPYNTRILRLPIPFTRLNGINEGTKMTLLDKYGVEWPTNPRLENDGSQRIRLVGGWKGFLQANSVETNDSYMLELIREEDTSCVLKFCSKVKLETK